MTHTILLALTLAASHHAHAARSLPPQPTWQILASVRICAKLHARSRALVAARALHRRLHGPASKEVLKAAMKGRGVLKACNAVDGGDDRLRQ